MTTKRLTAPALAWARRRLTYRDTGDDTVLRVETCPICGDEEDFRHGLYLERGFYFCFRNSCSCDIVEFVRLHDRLASRGEALAVLLGLDAQRSLADLAHGGTALDALGEKLADFRRGRPAPGELALPEPETFSVDWRSCKIGLAALRYAEERSIPPWFIGSGRLGFCTDGWLHDRLVFLTLWRGALVWAAGRTFRAGILPKYLFPLAEQPLGKTACVFNLDLFLRAPRLIVAEGTISALAVPGGVAIHGHQLSDRQVELIVEAGADEVVLAYDPDVAPAEVWRDALRLVQAGQRTKIAWLTAGDPAEAPAACREAVDRAELVTRFHAIRGRAREVLGRRKNPA